PPINELIQNGVLPILVECLKEKSNINLQFEASWALVSISSGNSEQTTQVESKLHSFIIIILIINPFQVVAAGAVPYLLEFLDSPNLDICEPAFCALANIIGDGPLLRDFLIRMGVVQSLLSFLQWDRPPPIVCNVILVIGNLCRHYDPPIKIETGLQILPALEVLISHEDMEILKYTLWAISFLAGAGQEHIQMVIESGMLPEVICLMGHEEVKVQRAALRALREILAGTDEQCQLVLDHNPLSYFATGIFYADKKIHKEQVQFLWRVTSRNHHWVQAIINEGLLAKILEMLKDGGLQERAVAARAISNLTVRCNEDQLLILVLEGVLRPFCDLLTCQFEEITRTVLSGLSNMLQVAHSHADEVTKAIYDCGGLTKIESLQTHESVEIYKQAQQLIDLYF
ncbi:hypothetical protein KR084_002812, partial [Drosophila pseudotakahashii]